MRKYKIAALVIFMIAVVIIAFALSIFRKSPLSNDYIISAEDSLYSEVITETFPDIIIEETKYQTAMRNFNLGDNIAVYSSEAIPLVNADENYAFFPHITKTVVIAVDRDITDEKIDSFSDLLTTNHPINFDFGKQVAPNMWDYPKTHQIVIAMANALYGEYDIEAIALDIHNIDSENRFFTDDMTKPVLVTSDSTAVELIKSGRNLEIIIPADGTLSFDFGAMVYGGSIKFSDELNEQLIEYGFRLPSGDADFRYFPPAADYERASYPLDDAEYSIAAALVPKTLRRDSFNTRLYGFTNSIEVTAFFLPLLLITICYMISIKRRIADAKIRKYIFATLILLLFFITAGLMKSLNSTNEVIETALWYLYYLPILFMPALFVNTALKVGRATLSKRVLVTYRVYFILTFIPLLFVLTNNFHNWVFIVSDYMGSYFTHNIGYYIVMMWVALSVLFAYTLLVYKSIASPRKQMFIYPAALSIILLFYAAARVLRFTPVVEFDLTFAINIMVILYIEACMQSRLFPTNKGYSKFFKYSNLAMEITDNNDAIAYKSLVTKDVNENFVKRSSDIIGGKFYYFEDYTAINTAEMKLSNVNEKIKKNNKFLIKKQKVKADLAALSAEKSAYSSIDNILQKGTEKIRYYIEQISHGADKKRIMTAINVCATIMKRDSMYRINALYKESQSSSVLVNSFVEIRELIDDEYLSMAIRCAISKNLSTAEIAVIYSFFSEATKSALDNECSSILFQIYEDKGEVLFSAVADRPLYSDGNFPELPKYKNAYKVRRKSWEDSEIYLINFKGTSEVKDD